MEPQLEKSPAPGLTLPQPQVEQGAGGFPTPERPLGSPESGVHAAAPYPASTTPVVAGPLPLPQPGVQLDPGAMAAPATALSDEAADELEKELISRAKAIVERTKNDPYVQSSELGKAKAEYLRARYNKHIKVAEEHAK